MRWRYRDCGNTLKRCDEATLTFNLQLSPTSGLTLLIQPSLKNDPSLEKGVDQIYDEYVQGECTTTNVTDGETLGTILIKSSKGSSGSKTISDTN